MIGSRIGPWLIDAELGRGGMGAVYRALRTTPDPEGPDRAAIKVLAAELAVEVGFRQRFEREVEILRKLDHPNIVRFYESGDQGGRCYYVMEYVPGRSYEQILDEKGRLSWREVLALALQVAPALKHAHDRGVIHRDLKPSNLLHDPDDPQDPQGPFKVKLTDFGIASLFASPHLTVTGGVIGTPEYLSPEQATGKQATRRSDLYSFGVVLYTLLTGRTPFTGSPVELLQKHCYGQFDKPSRIIPDLPPDLEEIVCTLLEKDPAKRFPDAGVLFRKLDSFRRKMERMSAPQREEEETSEETPKPRGAHRSQEGPATLMSRLLRRHLDEDRHGGVGWRFLNHPVIVVLLLAVTVGLIGWALWPLGPEGLYSRGAALMASQDPEDWDKAWEKYLGPLEEKYPEHAHQEEVAEFHRKYQNYLAGREAGRWARLAHPQSEAEWFYYQGLRLRRRGEEVKARQVWQRLADAFHAVPAEEPWVRKAKEEMAKPAPGPREAEGQWQATREVSRAAEQLRAEGKVGEAETLERALEGLYEGDPGARGKLKEVKKE